LTNLKVLVAVVAVALVSAAVPIAQGTSDSIPSRLTAVERKVRKLQTDLATTQRTVAALRGCITAVAISDYGGLETEGYVYRNTGENREFLTSALDVTDQGDQPDAIMATLRPECVTQALSRTPSAKADRRAGNRLAPTLRLKPISR
jgi:hypothetical protein